MNLLRRLVARASFVLAALAGIGTLAMMALICADVTMRFLAGSIPGTLEVVSYYLMVMAAFLPLAQIERRDQMISVDSLYSMSSRRLRLGMSALVAIGLLAVYAVITFVTWQDAMVQFRKGAFLVTLNYTLVVWPAYFIAPVAFAMATLVIAVRLIDIVTRGDLPEDHPEAGGGMSDEVQIKAGMI